MKPHTPALTPAALAAAAGKKTVQVQRQLKSAEVELQTSNAALIKALPANVRGEVAEALQHNVAAEEKVHEAAENLEVVKELLSEADPEKRMPDHPRPARKKSATGKTGEGAKSLISHLRRHS
jgi:hypothetical protein